MTLPDIPQLPEQIWLDLETEHEIQPHVVDPDRMSSRLASHRLSTSRFSQLLFAEDYKRCVISMYRVLQYRRWLMHASLLLERNI